MKQELDKGLVLLGGYSETFSAKTTPEATGLPRHKITAESRLVLKPNLLAKTDPDKACTTHPAVFHAVGKVLQEAGYTNLKYGDSRAIP